MARKVTDLNRIKKLIDTVNRTLPEGEELELTIEDETDEPSINPTSKETSHLSNSKSEPITFIELAMINTYLHSSYIGKYDDFVVSSYGVVDNIGRINFGGAFELTAAYWFSGKFKGDVNEYIFQTKMHVDNRNELVIQLNISSKKGLSFKAFDKAFDKIIKLAFNNSEFKGKCIKIKLNDGRFKGVEIIDVGEGENELILTDVQKKFIDHFVTRVGKGSNARYLLNGEPGTGKTETIRDIARRLLPMATFIIPDFDTDEDLTTILEACEIFENGVIIMDDIDLYLGSRDNGSYTRLLGQFLSFFDGVKKRKISLIASTNDKGLVDKAAERPGRFNFTIDYSFLTPEQIIKVCDIHLPSEWRTQEIYDALTEKIKGRKVNITGAFIANLADNIREMSEGDTTWSTADTVSLIRESYKGFYSSQVEKERQSMGFTTNQPK